MSSKSVFDEVYGPSTNVFDEVYGPKKPSKPQEPFTLKGAATAYGSGYGGGAGGILPDILNQFTGGAGTAGFSIAEQQKKALEKQSDNQPRLQGVHELTKTLAGGKEPQNALERILEQAGIFGGQEGLIGAGLGGPAGPAGALAGVGLGTAHGSITGTVYGSLKEAGVPDEWALLGSAIATISPIAFQKAWPKLVSKLKSGATAEEAYQSVFSKSLGTEGGPPPGGAGPGGGSGAEGDLIKKITGENLPVSKFETAEQALKEITDKYKPGEYKATEPKEIPANNNNLNVQITPQRTEGGRPQGTVARPQGPGAAISPVEFESEAAGGRAQNATIRDNAANDRREVTQAYREAEENYADINSIQDQLLINELTTEVERIQHSVMPNTAEASVLGQSRVYWDNMKCKTDYRFSN